MASTLLRWTLSLLVTLSVAWPGLGQTPLEIMRTDDIVIDGSLDEWPEAPLLVLEPGLEGPQRKSRGKLSDGDLRIALRVRWSEEALYAAIEWSDDQWDVTKITFDNMFWTLPDGSGEMDRLHLYDGLVLRLFREGYLYALLLAPRVGDDGPFQWDMLREGGEEATRREYEASGLGGEGATAVAWTRTLSTRWGSRRSLGARG